MAFFQSLPIDVKIVIGAFVALALLTLFTHNQRTEKYYMVVLVLLAAGGLYRYNATKPPEKEIAVHGPMTPPPPHRPLETAR